MNLVEKIALLLASPIIYAASCIACVFAPALVSKDDMQDAENAGILCR